MRGAQTAVVVGPSGEEIHTEKNGQVKVQFHWDRLGQQDENSSCWIRVSHPWAGKGWGSVSIPRIGQEVIVDFLEGDPDRPIITGRVYNAEAMPPYGLPDAGVVSGVKSATHKGSGYNEMSMNDTAGKEKVTIHAQYDMGTTVEHDDSLTVHNNRNITVDGTHTETIKKDTKITVSEGNLNTNIATGKSDEYVKANKGTKVDGEYALEVKKDANINVTTGNLLLKTASGTITEDSKGGHNIKSAADVTLDGKNIKSKAQAEITVDGMKIALTGQTEVTLSVGANFVKIDPSGVTIFGTLVKIN
jgi:type VI secretion system secreted protein VgrG